MLQIRGQEGRHSLCYKIYAWILCNCCTPNKLSVFIYPNDGAGGNMDTSVKGNSVVAQRNQKRKEESSVGGVNRGGNFIFLFSDV